MDLEEWQAANGRYLAASLHWLRLRLTELAKEATVPEIRPADATAPPLEPLVDQPIRSRLGGGFFRARQRPAIALPAMPSRQRLPPAQDLVTDVREAADARAEAAAIDPPPALVLLSDQLQLTPFERDVLLLCAGMDLDTRIPSLCARATGSDRPYPTFSLALAALESPSWDALSPQRPLRYWRLLELDLGPSQPLTLTPLRADERIVHYIKGLNTIPDQLSSVMIRIEAADAPVSPSQQAKVDEMLTRLANLPPREPPPIAVMLGTDVTAKVLIAQQVAHRLGRQLYRLSLDAVPTQPAESIRLARLWRRESALLALTLFIDTHVDGASPDALAALDRLTSDAVRSDSVIMIGTREPLARMNFPAFTFDVSRPTSAEQRDAWTTALTVLSEAERRDTAGRLASQYSLNIADIRRIVRMTPADPAESLAERLWDACRDRARPRLETLTQRIEPGATWDDLVVTDETLRLLREIVAQSAHRSTVHDTWGFADRKTRGLGISALFAGDSGTGKTLAAEVIASELRLALYRIDLSQVVSKYIGETEKNLQRVFDLMEGGGAILFFDEADALFGKRSEVRDSHDRYANIEINYLLQRMESYTGLAILATNMKNALDTAFIRRLRFIVPFNFPGAAERRQIWAKVFPPAVPKEPLDYDRLAKLHCTGASIHNIALNAAFLAARDRTPVTMPLVFNAARTEFRKLERPINEADLKS